jgi:hypothetical protein
VKWKVLVLLHTNHHHEKNERKGRGREKEKQDTGLYALHSLQLAHFDQTAGFPMIVSLSKQRSRVPEPSGVVEY